MYKRGTLDLSQSLIITPSGDFKQVSEEFQCGDLMTCGAWLFLESLKKPSKNHEKES